jgi:alpha-amylase
VYYGQEQILTGSGDPGNREALWLTGYPTDGSKLYMYFGILNQIRNYAVAKDSSYLTSAPTLTLTSNNVMTIKKGGMVTVINNLGSKAKATSVMVSGFSQGAAVIDAIACQKTTADRQGRVTATITGGLPKVYYAQSMLQGSGICNL